MTEKLFEVCFWCKRYFDPANGEIVTHVVLTNEPGTLICKECVKKREVANAAPQG